MSFISFISCDSPKKSENNSVPIETQYKNQIYGLWNNNHNLAYEWGNIKTEDNITYMRGDKFNTEGTLTLIYSDREMADFYGNMIYNDVATGEWKVEGDYIIETTDNFKILPHESYANKDENILEHYNESMELMNNIIPKGMSFSNKILNIDSETMILQDQNPSDPQSEFTTYKRVKN